MIVASKEPHALLRPFCSPSALVRRSLRLSPREDGSCASASCAVDRRSCGASRRCPAEDSLGWGSGLRRHEHLYGSGGRCRSYATRCTGYRESVIRKMGHTQQLTDYVTVYGTSLTLPRVVECLERFLVCAAEEKIPPKALAQHTTAACLLQYLEKRMAGCELGALKEIGTKLLPRLHQLFDERSKSVKQLATRVFQEAGTRMDSCTASETVLDLCTMMLRCMQYEWQTDALLPSRLARCLQLRLEVPALLALGRVIKKSHIRNAALLNQFFHQLAACTSANSVGHVQSVVEFLCTAKRWIPPNGWRPCIDLVAHHGSLFDPTAYTHIVHMLCDYQFLSPLRSAAVLMYVASALSSFTPPQRVQICFSATIAASRHLPAMDVILDSVVTNWRAKPALDPETLVKLVYGLCYVSNPKSKAVARELAEECLRVALPRLMDRTATPPAKRKAYGAIFAEICTTFEMEWKIPLAMDNRARGMIEHYGKRAPEATDFLSLVERYRARLPSVLRKLVFKPHQDVGPYCVTLADHQHRLVLNSLEVKPATGWCLRHRHLTRLGYRCKILNLLDVHHASEVEHYTVSLLTEAIGALAVKVGAIKADAGVVQSRSRRLKRKGRPIKTAEQRIRAKLYGSKAVANGGR